MDFGRTCLIIVPARGGSKRLPGKNIKKLGGISLLEHTARAIATSKLDVPVILSTDDDAIAAEGRRLGWSVPFRRPQELATDDASSVDVVLHALDTAYAGRREPDMVMLLQPTSPFRGAECLTRAVAMLNGNANVDSVVGMTKLHVSARYIFSTGESGEASSICDDETSPLYYPNGAMYLTRTRALRRERSVYAGRIVPLVMSAAQSVDIDTLEDWQFAEALLGQSQIEKSA